MRVLKTGQDRRGLSLCHRVWRLIISSKCTARSNDNQGTQVAPKEMTFQMSRCLLCFMVLVCSTVQLSSWPSFAGKISCNASKMGPRFRRAGGWCRASFAITKRPNRHERHERRPKPKKPERPEIQKGQKVVDPTKRSRCATCGAFDCLVLRGINDI